MVHVYRVESANRKCNGSLAILDMVLLCWFENAKVHETTKAKISEKLVLRFYEKFVTQFSREA